MPQTINGTFIQNLPTQEGVSAKGHWVRGEFVIEYGDEYKHMVAFQTFSEKVIAAQQKIQPGTPVAVSFHPDSREYNGKWYTSLNAVYLAPIKQSDAPAAATAQSQFPTDFQAQGAQVAMPEKDDDLPF